MSLFSNSHLAFESAENLLDSLRSRRLSVREVTDFFLARIGQIDGAIGAWVTVDPAGAQRRADELDASFSARMSDALFGLPVAIKDLTPTAGVRTTFGSTFFRDFIPSSDAVLVTRIREAGGVILGKTNTPEFGVGGNTFNRVRGITRNPWDQSKTAGGSSGGSAAALASGMCTVAEGSDFGGSLRIPAAFCGVVGFRTSPGLVPQVPARLKWDGLAVTGPMGRTVDDVARMLDVIAGPHADAPLSIGRDSKAGGQLSEPAVIGLCRGSDLLPLEPPAERALMNAAAAFEDAGAQVVEDCPDFEGLPEVGHVLRCARMAGLYGQYVDERPTVVHPGLAQDVESGRRMSADELVRAQVVRGEIHTKADRYWDRHHAMLLPTTPRAAFDVDLVAPTEVAGQPMGRYSDWMMLTYAISLMGWPSLAIPAPRERDWSTPLGVQLIGPTGSDWTLIELARRYERAVRWSDMHPTFDG